MVADLIPTAARPCLTASSPRWAVVTRNLSPDMVTSSLPSILLWRPGRRPGWIVRIQPSCEGRLQRVGIRIGPGVDGCALRFGVAGRGVRRILFVLVLVLVLVVAGP